MRQDPAEILVLRFGALGDVVLTTPALEALRAAFPTARMTYVTKAAWVPLVEAHPDLDRVVGLRPRESVPALLRRMRPARPFVALDLHGKLRSRLLGLFADRVVRWEKRPVTQALAVRLLGRPYRARKWIADRYHEAVERLAGRELPRAPMWLHVPASGREEAGRVLAEAGLRDGEPFAAMAPGAMWGTKRWPEERFAELALRCVASGMRVVWTGSPAERALTGGLARRTPGSIDLGGRLTVAGLVGVLERARAVVSNDSGPMHVARALRTPTLAIFGSTDPGQFDFRGHGLLYAGVPCAPCSLYGRRRCPRRHFDCMLSLSVERAWASLQALLNGPERTAPILG